ncbi:MAG TPA: NAD(P)H-binding protein [Polyangia bacterium]|nr:NAD(P)H-binding protein [Polyangia bacterium]
MRILIFGATGVLGRAAIPHLAGHAIGGTTRAPSKVAALAAMAVEPIICDAYDAAATARVAQAFRPELVVSFLTDLAGGPGPANSRLRRQGAPNVTAAARAAGARRLVVESIAFPTSPDSEAAVAAMERDALDSGLEALIMRFGRFWGPDTWSAERPAPPSIEVREAGRRAAELIVSAEAGVAVVAEA